MDKIKIDSHKLIYHIPRVYHWLKRGDTYPIYIEIGIYGGCNHRCIFCAFDFLKYKPDILDKGCLERFVKEAADRGVKAILYSGEGEPLLHKDVSDIIMVTRKSGIDVALVTNGVMLDKEKSKRILGHLTWLKVSLDAGTEETYAVIHGAKRRDFNTVINNIKGAVKIKEKNRYNCTIGVQFLLLPQNYRGVAALARILAELGVDYLVIKPYSQHPSSINKIGANLNYRNLLHLQEKLAKYSRGNFRVLFRRNAMEKLSEDKKPYDYCLGLPFATHITAAGDVYPCNIFVGKKEFVFGNICQESFKQIWQGRRRKKIMHWIYNNWDIKNCRKSCRLDEINRYLWELKNPDSHVNFI